MQAPGGPKEDISGGFKNGGWTAPYDDEVGGKVMQKLIKPADLLLGRTTFEIWADYWPEHNDLAVDGEPKYPSMTVEPIPQP